MKMIIKDFLDFIKTIDIKAIKNLFNIKIKLNGKKIENPGKKSININGDGNTNNQITNNYYNNKHNNKHKTESFKITNADITNGYIDLAQTPIADSLILFYDGLTEPMATGINPKDGFYTLLEKRIVFNDSKDLYVGASIDAKYTY
ncbi:MAG: hypothetical protein ACTSXL_01750 [Alphaproteobacteria bacterium]|nr:MAG: hypothetical protein B6I23_02205 [Rickettsiaceae bacterium 4572_127]